MGNCATILEGNSGDRKLCLILMLCKNLESFFSSDDSDCWNENRAKACCATGLQTPEVHKDAEDERGAGLRDCIEVGQERRCGWSHTGIINEREEMGMPRLYRSRGKNKMDQVQGISLTSFSPFWFSKGVIELRCSLHSLPVNKYELCGKTCCNFFSVFGRHVLH